MYSLQSCTKEYSYEGGSSPFAQGTLKDSSGNCLHDSAVGTFYKGITPSPDTNYVEVEINVTQTGVYNISTDLQNGFRFADSGYFYNTGDTIIHLKPIGVPIDTGATFFTVSFNNDACYFFVHVQNGSTVRPGDWQFFGESNEYDGDFQSGLKINPTDTTTEVVLDGSTFSGDTTLSIDFTINASDIVPGTYTLANNAIVFIMIDGITPSIVYTADASTPGTDMTITITSYDSITKQITGTFTGTVQTASGSFVSITNGSFTATVI